MDDDSRTEALNCFTRKPPTLRRFPSQGQISFSTSFFPPTQWRPTAMSPPQITELANQTAQILDRLTEIIAQKVTNQLRQELNRIYEINLEPEQLHRSRIKSTQTSTHGSLWSINKLAADSGIQKGTWYKWIAQRRVPAVRLGRTVRIRDEDYRKLIQKSLRPEINLSHRSFE